MAEPGIGRCKLIARICVRRIESASLEQEEETNPALEEK
jgi:hypothetical protein